MKSGWITEQAVIKLKLSKPPPTGIENYQYLQQIWKQEQISSFKDFLRWYNNKDVVPTLEAMQKMIDFYHDKDIVMLKRGCSLTNLANFCLHKSTDAKFYPFTEVDKDLLEKIREDVVGGPSIIFTRKAVVDETFMQKSTNICKSIVGIDASQLYPYSMCQPIPTGLYTRWDFDSETSRFTTRQNKTLSLENMVMSYFQRTRPEFETGRNLTALVLMGFVLIATLCLKPWVAYNISVVVKSCLLLSLKRMFDAVARRERVRCIEMTLYTRERLQGY